MKSMSVHIIALLAMGTLSFSLGFFVGSLYTMQKVDTAFEDGVRKAQNDIQNFGKELEDKIEEKTKDEFWKGVRSKLDESKE